MKAANDHYAIVMNNLAVGLAKVWVTRIALRPSLVSPHVSARTIVVARRASWLLPVAAALALALAFVVPAWNNLAMLLIPLGRRLPLLRVPPGA